MTREDLNKMLEQFAILVLKTAQTDMDVDTQYEFISVGIDTITETIMFCTDKSRVVTPSLN